ncbi:MAG: flavodoxin-dependent (E)-4-hydroxy-3-methylbut-2-enyl-diphosphate synthase [Candidatus Omnitrophica bacterium]|nr:flavodoxin-dependent (E)-4-hydroxy-3-methylbut-2-enyl-diphosphate synthase [Candidatus Omnitrophota bacterium]
MAIKRRKTKVIKIGNVSIGWHYPIAVQSMAKTHTKNISRTLKQIKSAQEEGVHLIRVAVKDKQDAHAIGEIRANIDIPLIADIHFDYRLALLAIASGADKIRLNPGNIYKEKEISQIASSAKERGIPIRVGVNSGSLSRGSAKGASGLVKSALNFVKMLEKLKFYDIVISLKSSNLLETVEANRQIASKVNYPLHLGVTATGLAEVGYIKSAICLGMLLADGIGDTIRISLTADPAQEVRAAKRILAALDIGNAIDVIACPTCGRCEVDLIHIVKDLEKEIKTFSPSLDVGQEPLRVALMGCVVNGPGEAKCADLGLAFGRDYGLFFKKGKPVKKVQQDKAAKFLIAEIKKCYLKSGGNDA